MSPTKAKPPERSRGATANTPRAKSRGKKFLSLSKSGGALDKLGQYVSGISEPAWLAICVALGALARFFNLATSSIWHDEGYTMMLAPMDPVEILARTARDVHPPLHYIKLHYWMQIFGQSEFAARSYSVVLILATIVVGYYLTRRLFGVPAARLAALFLALGPFLVRYSQEARMYALVAFLLVLATFFMVRALQDNRRSDWIWYAVLIAASLYTHYYTVFMVIAHWGYMAARTLFPERSRGASTSSANISSVHNTSRASAASRGVLSRDWWLANIAAAVLFLPWVPYAYTQVTRVSGNFWIPKVTAQTLPHTLTQFLNYTSFNAVPEAWRLGLLWLLVGVVAAAFYKQAKLRLPLLLITLYAFTGPLLVYLISLGPRPLYIDRYFVFSAVGFYILLAVLVYHAPGLRRSRTARGVVVAALLALFVHGITQVYDQSDHQMRTIGSIVNEQYQPGDALVSGELYTFFDFSYYNQTGQQLRLWSPDGISGYGETSLFWEREDEVVINDFKEINPPSGHVWLIGKTGNQWYFNRVPSNWEPVGEKYEYGYSAAQKYRISPEPVEG